MLYNFFTNGNGYMRTTVRYKTEMMIFCLVFLNVSMPSYQISFKAVPTLLFPNTTKAEFGRVYS